MFDKHVIINSRNKGFSNIHFYGCFGVRNPLPQFLKVYLNTLYKNV